jgi:uncharacterized membrane protein
MNSRVAARDPVKWSFFALMGLCIPVVLWADEGFLINPADPHWKHIAPFKWLLLVHGLGGVTALVTGAAQFSTRIRRANTPLHRLLGKIYIGAVCISAPVAVWIGTGPAEPATMHVEQIFQGGLWCSSALVAWACILNGQTALHRQWMMRSYAFTLIFVLSRVPDAFISHYTDQGIADMLWALVIAAAISPEVIQTAQTLFKVRSARAKAAKTTSAPETPQQLAV